MRMNGIKLGKAFIRLVSTAPESPCPASLLAGNRINTEFLTTIHNGTGRTTACCIDPDSLGHPQIKTLASQAVSLVSTYPHKNSMAALFHFLACLTAADIGIFDLATSGSMLTAVVDREDQRQACDILARTFHLPVSHTPFQQVLSAEDKAFLEKNWPDPSASYVEEKIKTYGLTINRNLSLIRFSASGAALAGMAAGTGPDMTFVSAWGMAREDGSMDLMILCPEQDNTTPDRLQSLPNASAPVPVLTSGICMISFQGPHFGDRYGIAHQALSAMDRAGVALNFAGFTGASVNLVLPEAAAEQARISLEEVFEKP